MTFFFFEKKKKGDSRVAVIIPRSTVQLGKSMGTTNSNWSLETPNPHTLQALLVSGTSRNCNYSPRENSNLGCMKPQQLSTSCTTLAGGHYMTRNTYGNSFFFFNIYKT